MCIELELNFFARQTDNSVVNMESVKILMCFLTFLFFAKSFTVIIDRVGPVVLC